MSHETMPQDAMLKRLERPLPPFLKAGVTLAALVGLGGFVLLLLLGDPQRAWTAYLINWLFWTGLAQGGVLFHAVTNVAKGRWSAPLVRIGEASVAFLPVSFVMFLLLWFGKGYLWPWVAHPITEPHVKAFWLQPGFMFARVAVALAILYSLSLWFVYHSVRPDVALLSAGAPSERKALYARLTAGYASRGEAFSVGRRTTLAPMLIVAYAVCMSMVAFDVVMSLAPHWISNLLGGFFFMGAWLSGLMSLALLMLFIRRHFGLEALITPKHLHDLGKLCFGFTVFWAYTFFSQFLVIWYGNMPEETSFVFLRMMAPEWRGISTAMLVMCFLLPFVGLISVPGKKTPGIFATFAIISLLGLWVDRYVLTVPSIVQETPGHSLPLGLPEVVVTAGFFGVWALSYLWFVARFPIVSPTIVAHFAERRHHAHTSAEGVDGAELA
jgi:hypothetical protein